MMSQAEVGAINRSEMWTLCEELEPIYRTLVSPGFEQSLQVIRKRLPIRIVKIRSGTDVFGWIVPKSWTVRGGYLDGPDGERLFDFKDHPLFIGPYSVPISTTLTREELLPHLHTLPHLPDAMPLCPSYYSSDWKLGVPHRFKESLKPGRYRVHIDSEFRPGHLCIGELLLPGASRREVIITTYLCHPTMANDNMSGVAVAVELFKILAGMKKRRLSYRLIIVPETIGSIAYLHHRRRSLKAIAGGFCITCCGDPGALSLKKSWNGASEFDRAAVQAFKEHGADHQVLDYYLSGSDERQFNAPGFRIPMPAIMRTPPARFREYHSSADTLEFIRPEFLADTLQVILRTLYILDHNIRYKNRYQSEPFLTRYGIFKQVRTGEFGVFNKVTPGIDPGYLNQIVIHETDGQQDLLSIAEKYNCSFEEVRRATEVFHRARLVTPVKGRA